ncbi:pyrroline-5-carboxylate reductase [Entomoplasma ellychniae]|uniref:Pyrroline-5-carboxylate reductase n=2 Tax=Entomoplasmataceae TaxID=33925 RepID=A0A2S5RGV4_9MOLU|nr:MULTISPECIES: pyrroline-5-carboxylate reductase dimerization domain-containing protein [Entomoplasmataceae]PPE04895.1 pyrroline-5-carboxylate reductase [Entomoplasma ellychniae]PPE06566.1 pyrroline-5-carboxylate reductase [Mesoplasma corruscae]
MEKVLFIGLGHMGASLVKGVLQNNKEDIEVYGFDAIKEVQQKALNEISNLKSISEISDIKKLQINCIVIGVRPIDVKELCEQIDNLNLANITVICMANAVSISDLQKSFQKSKTISIIRMMPNMNASIQKSVTALATNNASADQLEFAKNLFKNCGIVEIIDENKFGTFTAISGCSPSYVISFYKAMTEYATENGFSKEQSFEIIKQTIIGSILNVSDPKLDLRKKIDQICVPGGSTIEGQKILDSEKFEKIVKKALKAADQKAKKL